MAKKSMIAKAKREPKHPVQGYHRCTVCGCPRASAPRVSLCRIGTRTRPLVGAMPGVTESSR